MWKALGPMWKGSYYPPYWTSMLGFLNRVVDMNKILGDDRKENKRIERRELRGVGDVGDVGIA